jgi:hypothetical protein
MNRYQGFIRPPIPSPRIPQPTNSIPLTFLHRVQNHPEQLLKSTAAECTTRLYSTGFSQSVLNVFVQAASTNFWLETLLMLPQVTIPTFCIQMRCMLRFAWSLREASHAVQFEGVGIGF